jgi:hypothetical protein
LELLRKEGKGTEMTTERHTSKPESSVEGLAIAMREAYQSHMGAGDPLPWSKTGKEMKEEWLVIAKAAAEYIASGPCQFYQNKP